MGVETFDIKRYQIVLNEKWVIIWTT